MSDNMSDSPAHKAVRIPIDALPLVDISAWASGGREERRALAERVFGACRDVGFMYIAGHGISAATISSAFTAAQQFFALPQAEKDAVHYRLGGYRRGYLPLLSESSDPGAAGDLKEAFDIGLDPAGRRPYPGIEGGAIRNVWPGEPPGFRSAVEAYFEAVRALAGELFEMLALGMGLASDWFEDKIDKPIATMRLLHYPPQEPSPAGDVLGIGEHCDYECLTLLAQQGTAGLQVRSQDNSWIEAQPVAGTFVVNVGEMLARWTNDELIATSHRVVNSSGRERFSIPLFFATNPDVLIEPIRPGPVGDPPRYATVKAGDYLAGRLSEIYGVKLTDRPPSHPRRRSLKKGLR